MGSLFNSIWKLMFVAWLVPNAILITATLIDKDLIDGRLAGALYNVSFFGVLIGLVVIFSKKFVK